MIVGAFQWGAMIMDESTNFCNGPYPLRPARRKYDFAEMVVVD